MVNGSQYISIDPNGTRRMRMNSNRSIGQASEQALRLPDPCHLDVCINAFAVLMEDLLHTKLST